MANHKFDIPLSEASPYLSNILSSRDLNKLEKKDRRQKRNNGTNQVAELVHYKPKPLHPKSENQAHLINCINHFSQVITIGAAGTGKTYIPAVMAAHMFLEKTIDKIILTRPNVPAGRSLGFFPGTIEEKMAPWMVPITSVLQNILGARLYELAVKRGDIEIVPFEVIRGHTFQDAFVILDEAQNTEVDEIKAFLTRIGSDTKVVINGDVAQTDIDSRSGLAYILDIVNTDDNIGGQVALVEFTSDDIVRSGICKDWVKAFERKK